LLARAHAIAFSSLCVRVHAREKVSWPKDRLIFVVATKMRPRAMLLMSICAPAHSSSAALRLPAFAPASLCVPRPS
jgi:hypothetical protein